MSAETMSAPAARAHLAAALLAVDPGLGGVVLRARAGPARDAWLAAFRACLAPHVETRRMPTGITSDALNGGLDLTATLRAGRPVAQRGLLAQAAGGVLVLAMAERVAPGVAAQVARALDAGGAETFSFIALDEG